VIELLYEDMVHVHSSLAAFMMGAAFVISGSPHAGSLSPCCELLSLLTALLRCLLLQNNCLQPRPDGCALRQLRHCSVPADRWQGTSYRGMLLPEEGRISCSLRGVCDLILSYQAERTLFTTGAKTGCCCRICTHSCR